MIIALKATANREFPKLFPPLVGPHTAVLTCRTAWKRGSAGELFPPTQILGGLCFVCLKPHRAGCRPTPRSRSGHAR